MSDLPPQGWYADPSNGEDERFWDGTSWSEQTRPKPSLQPPPQAQAVVPGVATFSPQDQTPTQAPTQFPAAPVAQNRPAMANQAPDGVLAGTVGLPANVTATTPGVRLISYVVDYFLALITLGIGWAIWAAMLAPKGQTPGKKLMNHRVISVDTIRPVGFANMFWMRGLVGGFVATFATLFTLGIILFMPFWDKRNQNLWDKISGTYVVSDPTDAWGLEPDLR